MAENGHPDFIAQNADGSLTVTLARGIKIAGALSKTVTMREPTVGDQIAVSSMQGGDAVKEVALFANLCTVTPDEIKGLAMRDYTRIQQGYRVFFD